MIGTVRVILNVYNNYFMSYRVIRIIILEISTELAALMIRSVSRSVIICDRGLMRQSKPYPGLGMMSRCLHWKAHEARKRVVYELRALSSV